MVNINRKENINKCNPYQLIELLKGKKIYIEAHNFPDPDAIGSSFGLQKFLEHFEIEAIMCYVGGIDRLSTKMMLENFGITLYSYEDIKETMSEEDYVVNVDCQKPNANTTDIIGNEIACIDHHPVFIETDEYKYTDIRITGACASIVASYYKETGIDIEKNVAAALAYAIKMDTDDLIRGMTEFDMEMLSFLFTYADWTLVSSMYNQAIEYMDLKAYGAAIENIKLYDHVGFTHIPFECSNALVAILCDFVVSLDVVQVAVVYSVNEDGIKFSVRSIKNNINAGKLTQAALKDIGSGGGHSAMAGGFISKAQLRKLGNDYDPVIKDLFLKQLNVVK